MSDFQSLLAGYEARYADVNRRTLQWMLSRSEGSAWLNTKFHPISHRDYTVADDLRGPGIQYGWIQGRGLEALIRQSRFFLQSDTAFGKTLKLRSKVLYSALLCQYQTIGHASFCTNTERKAICTRPGMEQQIQVRDPDIYTYSDLFVLKGLIAGSVYHDTSSLPIHLQQLHKIIGAIDDGRFLIDESSHITEEALLLQREDLGPRMIAIGAASLLHQLDLSDHDTFSTRYLVHILDHHRPDKNTVPANTPGEALTNPGHIVELIGLYLEAWGSNVTSDTVALLKQLLLQTFKLGFNGSGIVLSANVQTQQPDSVLCPWWSLPETIRAAALLYRITPDQKTEIIWQQAHDAFFSNYWQNEPPVAYQMCVDGQAVDQVPATPDLDPGYHTGLSLLTAIEVIQESTREAVT